MRVALIKNGTVENVILAGEDYGTPDGYEAVPSAEAGPGWTYENGAFVPPDVVPEPVPPQRQFSFLEFMDLFTADEQLVLVEASMTLPAIKLWYDKALGAQFIDLDDPRTEPGLQKLVDENLISPQRKASVMAGQGPA
jgi:hypothetical protein